MFISKTNVLKGRSPSVVSGVSSDLPSNVTSADFSLNYTASGERLTLSFGSVSNVEYIAVCASNLGASGRITVRNGQSTATFNSVRGQYLIGREHVCMFNFDRESFSDLIIVVDSDSASVRPTVSYVAAGESIEVPNDGESGGYNRNWLTRSTVNRNVTNGNGAPITNLKRKVALNGSLSLPNMTTEFCYNDWQEFLDYAESGPFFICEQQTVVPFITNYATYRDNGALPESSYICFNPRFTAPKAHNSTRALNDISIGFSCYNGL